MNSARNFWGNNWETYSSNHTHTHTPWRWVVNNETIVHAISRTLVEFDLCLITMGVHWYRGMWLHVAWNTCTLRLQLWHFNGSMLPLHRWRHCWISSLLWFSLIVHISNCLSLVLSIHLPPYHTINESTEWTFPPRISRNTGLFDYFMLTRHRQIGTILCQIVFFFS